MWFMVEIIEKLFITKKNNNNQNECGKQRLSEISSKVKKHFVFPSKSILQTPSAKIKTHNSILRLYRNPSPASSWAAEKMK